MDKDRTKELLFAFRVIIVGIFFWIFQFKYFTIFIFPSDHILNSISLELFGSVLIFLGVFFIRRYYPFAFTFISEIYIVMIIIYQVLELFFIYHPLFQILQKFTPFFMSIMLFFIAKLLQNGIKYFGGGQLAKQWSYFAVIIFFGFSIPYYTYALFNVCGFLKFQRYEISSSLIILAIPLLLLFLFMIAYYLLYLIKSFKFLLIADSEYKKKDKKKKIVL